MKSPIYVCIASLYKLVILNSKNGTHTCKGKKWRQLDSGREGFEDAKYPNKLKYRKNIRKSLILDILDIAPYTISQFTKSCLELLDHNAPLKQDLSQIVLSYLVK